MVAKKVFQRNPLDFQRQKTPHANILQRWKHITAIVPASVITT